VSAEDEIVADALTATVRDLQARLAAARALCARRAKERDAAILENEPLRAALRFARCALLMEDEENVLQIDEEAVRLIDAALSVIHGSPCIETLNPATERTDDHG
jgi:hypothetical protein